MDLLDQSVPTHYHLDQLLRILERMEQLHLQELLLLMGHLDHLRSQTDSLNLDNWDHHYPQYICQCFYKHK